MPSTPGLGLPYPPRTGVTPNVARDLEALAVALDRAVPRGLISYRRKAAGAGPATKAKNFLTIAGLSQTVTLRTARTLEVMFTGQFTSGTNGTTIGCQVYNRTKGTGLVVTETVEVATRPHQLVNFDVLPLAAGTYTFDVRLVWWGGGGGAHLTGSPSLFSIKDVGPA